MLKKTKYHFLFLGIVLSLYSQTSIAKVPKKTQSLSTASKSFVKVFRELNILKCKEGKKCVLGTFRSTGSGASVMVHKKYNTILTAGHLCIPNVSVEEFGHVKTFSMSIAILNYKNEIRPAEIISKMITVDEKDKSDLCMLYVHDLKIPKLKLSQKPPQIGDKVIAMSAPGGVYHPPVVPMFSGLYSGDINNSTSMVTVSSSPGSSGGPVMNSSYEVVGIIYAVFVHHKQVTLMNNHKITKSFVDSIKKIIDLHEKKTKK